MSCLVLFWSVEAISSRSHISVGNRIVVVVEGALSSSAEYGRLRAWQIATCTDCPLPPGRCGAATLQRLCASVLLRCYVAALQRSYVRALRRSRVAALLRCCVAALGVAVCQRFRV